MSTISHTEVDLIMRLITAMLLRLLLFTVGKRLAFRSRVDPSIRSQITKTVTFEISTDDGVARHWHFDGQQRRITTGAGPSSPAQVLHFQSSRQALRVLLSPRCIREVCDGLMNGTIRLQGSLFLLFWFFGLTRKFGPMGRENGRYETGPRGPLPGRRYIQHDPNANGSEKIIIEPAVTQLDPNWTNAWEQRAKLLIVRATTGEPMPRG